MPHEFNTLKMADSELTVADFIRSRPKESAPFLISAVSRCLQRKCCLNEAELQIQARVIRYAH